jgi:hypothetical protein
MLMLLTTQLLRVRSLCDMNVEFTKKIKKRGWGCTSSVSLPFLGTPCLSQLVSLYSREALWMK